MAAYTSRNQLVEQLRRSVPIVDLAQRLGLSVARRGKSQLTLCPFHQDKTPSLNLFDGQGEDSHYHCFACGAHGDIFSLVQHIKQLDFRSAVHWLAQSYGAVNPVQTTASNANRSTDRVPAVNGLPVQLMSKVPFWARRCSSTEVYGRTGREKSFDLAFANWRPPTCRIPRLPVEIRGAH